MPHSYVPYDLQAGYVHHWLVGGPQIIELERPESSAEEEAFRAQSSRNYYSEASGISRQPVEPGPLDESAFVVGDCEGLWAFTVCGEDHYVDLTAYYPVYCYLRGWAYTQLMSARDQTVSLAVTAAGPADVWLNGLHIYRGDAFGLHHDTVEASLGEGVNELLVRFEQVGERACLHQMALRVSDATEAVSVRIPTAIKDVAHRNRLASAFERAYLDRDVFSRDEMIQVQWPEDLGASEELTIRVQTPSGRIYAESKTDAVPGQPTTLVYAYSAAQGPLQLSLLPRTELLYDGDLRVVREMPMWGMGLEAYSEEATGTYAERRLEALRHAVRGGGLFAEIAGMALGQWDLLQELVFLRAIDRVNRQEAGSALDLVGVLGALSRWGEHPKFPESLRAAIEACVRGFQGWVGASDDTSVLGAETEPNRILLLTGEILAGRLYPDRVFEQSGQTGQWHREGAERLALDWLRDRGAGGFAAWDSAHVFAAEFVALSHLMDLSETEAVWQMVTVIMDKLLFTIALNSYQGVLGATQGAAEVTAIKGGLLAPTAGITRVLWGQGVYNHYLAGSVSAACMEDYALPPLMPVIATSDRDELWSRERHAVGNQEMVDKVTYRTPDYLLGSAQDYHPGEAGEREHVWQATLGPEAVVYTNHPASMGRSEGHTPGFWLGNATMPRVAQWKDTLVAVYSLPEDDWMGFTHAYFPAHAFDAYALREDTKGHTWAFARKGDGYLAITSSRGLKWVTQGPGAYRELRSHGRHAVWCCLMGRAALDGDFDTYQERVLSLRITFEDLAVSFQTLRGETVAFGWEGPLLRDGEEQPLSGFKHCENSYCVSDLGASEMEIRSDEYLMRLKLG